MEMYLFSINSISLPSPLQRITLRLCLIYIYHLCHFISYCSIVPEHRPVSDTKPYEGFALFQVTALNSSQLTMLQTLYDNDGRNELDFWTPPANVDIPCEVMISRERRDALELLFKQAGLKYNITIGNVQKVLDEDELVRSFKNSIRRDDASIGADGSFHLDRFHSYTEIAVHLSNLVKAHPNIAELFTGPYQTHEGRYVRGIKIGNKDHTTWQRNRPAFWIDGGAHAREWISPAVALYVIDHIITGYANDVNIKRYVDEMDFYILPVVNPDGYEYSRNKLRLWRKNRNPNGGKFYGITDHCNGVDLNRNFGFAWGGKGSSGDPCSSTYRGETPFSEPESQNLRSLLQDLDRRLRGYLSLHSYAQLWAYPYGHDKRQATDDVESIRVAQNAVNAVRRIYGTRYVADTSGNYLYPAAGAAADWVKSSLAVDYAYLIELPPKKNSYVVGFAIDDSKIIASGKELFKGVTVICDEILRNTRRNKR